ncbi:hypothetical protein ACX80N_04660 [Arthrobacter sp. MDT2-16]
MPKNTWLAAIALLLINAIGGLGFFLLSLPERSEWGAMITGIVCSIVATLLTINYRRTYGSRPASQS